MVAERFSDTSNFIVAEQVVKPCLLTPAPEEFLAKLARLEDMMLTTHANTSASNQHERNLGAWREFAIGLMEYRKGNRGGRTG